MSGKTFVEEEHPRADNGQFTKKGPNNEKKLFSYSKTSINNDFNNGDEKDYSKIKEEYENAVDNDLLNFINNHISNPNLEAVKVIARPTKRHISDVRKLLGVDVSDYNIVIDGKHVSHIINRHGPKGKADHSMADVNDIARIKYILDNYDEINILKSSDNHPKVSSAYNNSDNTKSKVLEIKKRINGYYVVSEAIVDAKNKKIAITSAFKNKK